MAVGAFCLRFFARTAAIRAGGYLRKGAQNRPLGFSVAAHLEPDLMLIDGGKAQLNAVISILRKSDFPWEVRLPKVVALAKRKEELYTENRIQPVRLNALSKDTAFFFQRVRDESHRFAKKYHHKLREILYREQGKI